MIGGVVTVTGVALAWLAVYNLNSLLFSELELTEKASWIFLPAALRIIFVLLFNKLGALGLVVGAYLTIQGSSDASIWHDMLVALSSGLSPWLAILFMRRLLGINTDLAGLRGAHILSLSIACAATNSVILNTTLILINDPAPALTQVVTIFVGDVLGAAIVLAVLAAALHVIERLGLVRSPQ